MTDSHSKNSKPAVIFCYKLWWICHGSVGYSDGPLPVNHHFQTVELELICRWKQLKPRFFFIHRTPVTRVDCTAYSTKALQGHGEGLAIRCSILRPNSKLWARKLQAFGIPILTWNILKSSVNNWWYSKVILKTMVRWFLHIFIHHLSDSFFGLPSQNGPFQEVKMLLGNRADGIAKVIPREAG